MICNGMRFLYPTVFGRKLFMQIRNQRSFDAGAASRCISHVLGKLPHAPSVTHGSVRYFGDQGGKNKFEPSQIDSRLMATYKEIVELPKHPEVLLIDVRQPKELAATGTIPTSINIPLKFVAEELKLSSKDFESKYGRPKPNVESPLIFCCRIGVRSGEAANIADKLGFTNVKNYVGSWLEYAQKNNLPQ